MRLVCERGHTNQDGQRQSNEKRLHVRSPSSGVKHRWLDRAPRARCSFCKPVLPALGIGRMSPRLRFVSFVSGLPKTMRQSQKWELPSSGHHDGTTSARWGTAPLRTQCRCPGASVRQPSARALPRAAGLDTGTGGD